MSLATMTSALLLVASATSLHVSGMLRPTASRSCAVRAIFPGEDPFEYVRQAAKQKAVQKLAAEGEERSEEYQEAYADAWADIEVQEFKDTMNGVSSDAAAEETPAATVEPVAAEDDDEEPPVVLSLREQVMAEIMGGVSVETDAQTAVYEALPDGLRASLQSSSIANVRLALALMRDDEVEFHRKQCVEAGLWRPADGQ